MVCAPVRRDNPRALASGLSIVQADNPCSISLVTIISNIDHARYGESRAKDWVSGACGTGSYKVLNLLVAVKTTARK